MSEEISTAEMPLPGDEPTSTPSEDVNKQDVPEPPKEGEEPVEQKAEPTEAEKIRQAMQKRIDRVTARAAQAERERDEYKGRVPTPTDTLKAPDEKDFDKYEDFLKAQGRYEADKERLESQAKEEQTKQAESRKKRVAEKQKSYEAAEVEIRKLHPDYDDAAEILNEYLGSAPQDTMGTKVFRDVLLESDNMAAMVYHLGKNPDLVESLFKMTPIQIARTLIKTELSLSESPKPPKTNPVPPKPIRGTGSSKAAENMSADELLESIRT